MRLPPLAAALFVLALAACAHESPPAQPGHPPPYPPPYGQPPPAYPQQAAPAPPDAPPQAVPPAAAALVDAINRYRGSRGLAPLPFSPALSRVGQAHVADLERNPPDRARGCTMHSWSSAGPVSGCCYQGGAQGDCMWRKPREIAGFGGKGYEIAAWFSDRMTPEQALDQWKGSPLHHAVILNADTWASMRWRSLGAGVSDHYAVAWFSDEPDPASPR